MYKFLPAICIAFLVFSSCKKADFKNSSDQNSSNDQKSSSTAMLTTTSGCIEDTADGNRYDSVLRPTILGYHLVNHPYSLTIMRRAYTNLYGNSTGVNLTNKYVRFKPSSPQQLSTLDSLDIELSDHPLDYDVVQEGDYYDDGVTPAEEIPWLYAVVDINFIPPSGITYEELEQIHVPALATVENEAFRITNNPVDDTTCGSGSSPVAKVIQPNITQCADGYHWDNTLRQCVANNCPQDYHWNGTQCVPDGPPAPRPTRLPSGTINVQDITLNTVRAVRNARVIAKRWLKIERTYTDIQGHFFLNKEFNRVHISVKFKNDQAMIRALRRARIWQVLFSVERNVGMFRGRLNNIIDNIPYATNALTAGAREWSAATAHNTVQEYYDYALQSNIGTPPTGIRILLSNWRNATGATPMYAKRLIQELPEDFLRFFILGSAIYSPVISGMVYTLKKEIDLTVGYNNFINNADITRRSSDFSEIMFHELTHAAHYNKVGNNWWNDFVDGELNNIIWHPNENPPYGNNVPGSSSDIIGLGESWAYHMGHFMADIKYGVLSDCTSEQADAQGFALTQFCPNPAAGVHPQIEVLEQYDPNLLADPDRWIPKGLYLDLIDARNENAPIVDLISGYSNQQFFNAFENDVRSVGLYRDKFLQQTGYNQQVINLFSKYHY